MAFDLTVHRRDPKTGRVVSVHPYKYVVSRDGSYYERDGIKYDGAGNVLEGPKAVEAVAEVTVAAPKDEPVKKRTW